MSLSGELESAVGLETAVAAGLNEGNPTEVSSSQGETNEPSAETTSKEPEKPKLWSEFSDDEDPIDTTLAREQLRKVCLASVGVRPCDVPTTSSQSLQRTKTTRYANSSTHGTSGTYPPSQNRKNQPSRRSYNNYGGQSSPSHSQRGRRQDSLSVWQEATMKSRPVPSTANSPPSASKRRFGGLSFDVLVSYPKSDAKADSKGHGGVERRSDGGGSHGAIKVEASTHVTTSVSKSVLINEGNGSKATATPATSVGEASGAPTSAALSTTCGDTSGSAVITEKASGGSEAKMTHDATTVKAPALSGDGEVRSDERPDKSSSEQISSLAQSSRKLKEEAPRVSTPRERNKSLMESSISTCSSTSVYVPRVSRGANVDTSSDDESNHDGPIEPRLREVDGDVIFDEKFDIWFTQPLSGSRRGLAKEVYENGMHLIGTFDTLSQFFEFHGILEWDDLPPSSVIAFCRHGIKPIWEDPANERGGRYLVKNFKREETESVFTKMALGFLSGMLHDWKHYNLISLHVRESRRGNDIQLWRSKLHSPKLTNHVVKADLQDFVENSQPSMTLSFVPNMESLSRNDSRLQQQSGNRRSKGGKHRGGIRGSVAAVAAYSGGSSHPVFQLYAQKGISKSFLGEEQKAAYARESEACLMTAAPHKADVSLSLTSDDRLTSCGDDGGFSPVSSEDSGIAMSFKRSDIDSGERVVRKVKGGLQAWKKSDSEGCGGDDDSDEVSPLESFRTRNSRAVDTVYPPPEYTAYVPPTMYYPPPHPQLSSMTTTSPENPYASMYGYGYYMAPQDHEMLTNMGSSPLPHMMGPWYDSSPPQTYWAPNCAPPDTLCLTPYSYPYVYTNKGTTYYTVPPMPSSAAADLTSTTSDNQGDRSSESTSAAVAGSKVISGGGAKIEDSGLTSSYQTSTMPTAAAEVSVAATVSNI